MHKHQVSTHSSYRDIFSNRTRAGRYRWKMKLGYWTAHCSEFFEDEEVSQCCRHWAVLLPGYGILVVVPEYAGQDRQRTIFTEPGIDVFDLHQAIILEGNHSA